MIVVATWPMMRAVQGRLGGRRVLAVAVMTAAMVVIVVGPITVGIVVVVEHSEDVVRWSKALVASVIAGPPAWLSNLPLIGTRLSTEWQAMVSEQPEDLAARVSPYLPDVGLWVVGQAGSLGLLLIQPALTVVLSALLYARRTKGLRPVCVRSRGGWPESRGDNVVVLSAQAIRAVALGIVVTALVQSGIGAIGLAVTGVPYRSATDAS